MSACCVWAKSPELLIAGRFFTGINCGMAANLAPMYIMEITPFNLRGAFGCACQLFVTLGIFAGAIAGLRELLGELVGTQLARWTRDAIKFILSSLPRHIKMPT